MVNSKVLKPASKTLSTTHSNTPMPELIRKSGNNDGDPGAVGGIDRGPTVQYDAHKPIESRLRINKLGLEKRLNKQEDSRESRLKDFSDKADEILKKAKEDDGLER